MIFIFMVRLEQFMINLVKYYGDSCKVKIIQTGEDNYRYMLSSSGMFIYRSKAERMLLYEQSEVYKRIDEDIENSSRETPLLLENNISDYLESLKF
jgi:hypothetical protein